MSGDQDEEGLEGRDEAPRRCRSKYVVRGGREAARLEAARLEAARLEAGRLEAAPGPANRRGSNDHLHPLSPTPGDIRRMFGQDVVSCQPEYVASPDPATWTNLRDDLQRRRTNMERWVSTTLPYVKAHTDSVDVLSQFITGASTPESLRLGDADTSTLDERTSGSSYMVDAATQTAEESSRGFPLSVQEVVESLCNCKIDQLRSSFLKQMERQWTYIKAIHEEVHTKGCAPGSPVYETVLKLIEEIFGKEIINCNILKIQRNESEAAVILLKALLCLYVEEVNREPDEKNRDPNCRNILEVLKEHEPCQDETSKKVLSPSYTKKTISFQQKMSSKKKPDIYVLRRGSNRGDVLAKSNQSKSSIKSVKKTVPQTKYLESFVKETVYKHSTTSNCLVKDAIQELKKYLTQVNRSRRPKERLESSTSTLVKSKSTLRRGTFQSVAMREGEDSVQEVNMDDISTSIEPYILDLLRRRGATDGVQQEGVRRELRTVAAQQRLLGAWQSIPTSILQHVPISTSIHQHVPISTQDSGTKEGFRSLRRLYSLFIGIASSALLYFYLYCVESLCSIPSFCIFGSAKEGALSLINKREDSPGCSWANRSLPEAR